MTTKSPLLGPFGGASCVLSDVATDMTRMIVVLGRAAAPAASTSAAIPVSASSFTPSMVAPPETGGMRLAPPRPGRRRVAAFLGPEAPLLGSTSMDLERLAAALAPVEVVGRGAAEVAELAYDAREAGPGSLFFCVR